MEQVTLITNQFFSDGELPLPLYICRVQAGFPSPADDYLDKAIDLNTFLITKPAATILVRVVGDSMKDAGITEGDILIVDKSLNAVHDSIVIAILDGEFTVKRFLILGGRPFLKAENKAYPIIDVSKYTDFEISGVVAYVIKCTKK